MSDPVFLDEQQIARALFGPYQSSITTWRMAVTDWRRKGMPGPERATGLWYYPAIRAWLDKEISQPNDASASVPWAGEIKEREYARRRGVRCARA